MDYEKSINSFEINKDRLPDYLLDNDLFKLICLYLFDIIDIINKYF